MRRSWPRFSPAPSNPTSPLARVPAAASCRPLAFCPPALKRTAAFAAAVATGAALLSPSSLDCIRVAGLGGRDVVPQRCSAGSTRSSSDSEARATSAMQRDGAQQVQVPVPLPQARAALDQYMFEPQKIENPDKKWRPYHYCFVSSTRTHEKSDAVMPAVMATTDGRPPACRPT